MRSRTANWFETKIRYEKTMDDGKQKAVTELYVVDALSFTEAEAEIIQEMSAYITGDFKVTGISQAPYSEIFFSDTDTDDRFFKTKLQFITIDEKTEKEKRSNVNYLVQVVFHLHLFGSFLPPCTYLERRQFPDLTASRSFFVLVSCPPLRRSIRISLLRDEEPVSCPRPIPCGCQPAPAPP